MKIETVNQYFSSTACWIDEIAILRGIVLSTGLTETLKWGMPTYTLEQKNIVGIGSFKSYFGLWFFQGAALKDEQKVLINAQKGKTGSLRQWRFTSADQVDRGLVKKYILEAIANQKAGVIHKPKKGEKLELPLELQDQFNMNMDLKNAFDSLSTGNKRVYVEYITDAKRETTRKRRIAKIIPMIREGKGLNDNYRKR
ncbi:MAG: YdeI/OmpD-associated family protein [bacterium]